VCIIIDESRSFLEGANVVLIGRNKQKLELLKNESDNINNFVCATDLASPIFVEKDFRGIIKRLKGKIDVLINAAGIVNIKPFKVSTLKDWDYSISYSAMNINVRSVFQVTSLCTPFLKESKGSVVCISSTAGLVPTPGSTLFSVSKAMLNSFVQCSALELANFGVRVNAVALGATYTQARVAKDAGDLNMRDNKVILDSIARATPLEHRINTPEEAADTILWLASDEASYITGEIITVDGGQSITTNLYPYEMQELVILIR